MSDRWRAEGHKTAPLDDPADEEILDPVIISGVGGSGGVIAGPLDSVDDHDTPTEEAVEDERDWESPEGDDALLRGHSPEFQRLRKRGQ
jgi:hypothetical protein